MKSEELFKKKGYLLKRLQYQLFDTMNKYLADNQLNQTDFARKLKVSKGYVSQIMNADLDHKLSKLVDLAICMGKVPNIDFVDIDIAMSKAKREPFSVKIITNIEQEHSEEHMTDVDSYMPAEAMIIDLKTYQSGRTSSASSR